MTMNCYEDSDNGSIHSAMENTDLEFEKKEIITAPLSSLEWCAHLTRMSVEVTKTRDIEMSRELRMKVVLVKLKDLCGSKEAMESLLDFCKDYFNANRAAKDKRRSTSTVKSENALEYVANDVVDKNIKAPNQEDQKDVDLQETTDRELEGKRTSTMSSSSYRTEEATKEDYFTSKPLPKEYRSLIPRRSMSPVFASTAENTEIQHPQPTLKVSARALATTLSPDSGHETTPQSFIPIRPAEESRQVIRNWKTRDSSGFKKKLDENNVFERAVSSQKRLPPKVTVRPSTGLMERLPGSGKPNQARVVSTGSKESRQTRASMLRTQHNKENSEKKEVKKPSYVLPILNTSNQSKENRNSYIEVGSEPPTPNARIREATSGNIAVQMTINKVSAMPSKAVISKKEPNHSAAIVGKENESPFTSTKSKENPTAPSTFGLELMKNNEGGVVTSVTKFSITTSLFSTPEKSDHRSSVVGLLCSPASNVSPSTVRSIVSTSSAGAPGATPANARRESVDSLPESPISSRSRRMDVTEDSNDLKASTENKLRTLDQAEVVAAGVAAKDTRALSKEKPTHARNLSNTTKERVPIRSRPGISMRGTFLNRRPTPSSRVPSFAQATAASATRNTTLKAGDESISKNHAGTSGKTTVRQQRITGSIAVDSSIPTAARSNRMQPMFPPRNGSTAKRIENVKQTSPEASTGNGTVQTQLVNSFRSGDCLTLSPRERRAMETISKGDRPSSSPAADARPPLANITEVAKNKNPKARGIAFIGMKENVPFKSAPHSSPEIDSAGKKAINWIKSTVRKSNASQLSAKSKVSFAGKSPPNSTMPVNKNSRNSATPTVKTIDTLKTEDAGERHEYFDAPRFRAYTPLPATFSPLDIAALQAHLDGNHGSNGVGGRYFSTTIPTLDESPSREDKESNPIAVAMELITAASVEKQESRRNNMFLMSRVLVDAINKTAAADQSCKDAQAFVAKACCAAAEVRMRLAECLALINKWKAEAS